MRITAVLLLLLAAPGCDSGGPVGSGPPGTDADALVAGDVPAGDGLIAADADTDAVLDLTDAAGPAADAPADTGGALPDLTDSVGQDALSSDSGGDPDSSGEAQDPMDSSSETQQDASAPPISKEEAQLLLPGVWEMTGMNDSGTGFQSVPPGSMYNVFKEDGTVLLQCSQEGGLPWTLVELSGWVAVEVDLGGGSLVHWVILALDETQLVYYEGGDEFWFQRRISCP
ncbi:MAG: hypothetical protein FJ098_16765 [Deltaproteobacteria bacterium]|nr:hypothetical protein [Deltaproteobacteria bacterium]